MLILIDLHTNGFFSQQDDNHLQNNSFVKLFIQRLLATLKYYVF